MSSEPRPPWTLRVTTGQLAALDVAAALAYGVLVWAVLADRGSAALGLVAATLIAAPLAMHRRRLLTAFSILLLACWLAPAANALDFLALPPLAFLLGRIAATRRTQAAALALGLALTGPVATALPDFTHRGALVPFSLLLVTVWTVGVAVGQRHRYGAALVEHRVALAQAEADQARQAVADQRLQIARELHDVVAHSMSVVTVQAAFGSLVFHERPDAARAALGIVEATGRQAMVEMRDLLGVLRDPSGDQTAGEPPLSPVERLGDIDRLLAQTARAGVRVELIVSGDARPLAPGIELSAYRIVQEALTNVVKHAHTDTAVVAIGYGADELSVVVSDAGSGSTDQQGDGGHGLVGIHERVMLYGGALTAGPLPQRGFQVAVTLPLAGAMT